MQVGVVFPQTEIGSDPGAIREYAQAAEALGYRHILAYDHVLGAGLANRPDWRGPYNSATPFHEPFVLFAFLAGLTRALEFVPGVIILPQRQTALVAKQAAALSVLSGGRLRLGVGIGWNPVEYQALGESFSNRGARLEEQIAVLRALWAEPVVRFAGRWHTIDDAGINPLPPRPIPLWIGASADAALDRAGRLGDGWFPQRAPRRPGPRYGRALPRGCGRRRPRPGRAGHRGAPEHWPGARGRLGRVRRELARARRDTYQRQHHGRRAEIAPSAYRRNRARCRRARGAVNSR